MKLTKVRPPETRVSNRLARILGAGLALKPPVLTVTTLFVLLFKHIPLRYAA